MPFFEAILNFLTPKKAILLIALIGFLTYFNILFNGFVWDDELQIVSNPIIWDLANLPQILSGSTFSTGGAGLSGWFFRPLFTFSYMLEYTLFGLNAWGFHLTQLIFHLINAILLFKILEKLLNPKNLKSKTFSNLLVSLIFVVHPAFVEAVAYIGSLNYIMLAFFNLLAFYLIIKSALKILKFKTAILVGSLLFCGMLFNESSIVIFPILFFYLVIYQNERLKFWVPVLITTIIIYFFVRLVLVNTPIRHPEYSPISELPLFQRLLTIPAELTQYLKTVFYPNDLSISQHFVVKSASFSEFFLPLLILLTFFGVLLGLALKWRSHSLFLGMLWFLTGFSLISNIIPLDMTVAERWLYFPSIGLMIIFAGILSRLKLNTKLAQFSAMALICVILILSVRTVVRNSNWKDGLALFSHDQPISKNSFDLENNLGVELFRKGEYKEAKVHFEKSIKLQPKWYYTLNNLGAVYEKEKNYEKAKEFYQKTLDVADYYLAYENMVQLLLFHEDAKKAKELATHALSKLPNNPRLWLLLALAEYKLENKKAALDAAKRSYNLQPSDQNYYMVSKLEAGQPVELDAR